MKYKSFDEFWAQFLQVTFHLENPDRWPSRRRKADWCQKHLHLTPGTKVLDLGCGDGLIDIWLSRMGMEVTAVDRAASVLKNAQQEDDTGNVKFLAADLRKLGFPDSSFQAVLFLEASGLMTKEEDQALLKKICRWLVPGGKLLIDCCESAEVSNSWSKTFPQGTVSMNSSFNAETRLQRIEFHFQDSSGESFGLFDPIRDDQVGISRHLYPKDEMTSMLSSAGFQVNEVSHYYEKNYYSLLGTK